MKDWHLIIPSQIMFWPVMFTYIYMCKCVCAGEGVWQAEDKKWDKEK